MLQSLRTGPGYLVVHVDPRTLFTPIRDPFVFNWVLTMMTEINSPVCLSVENSCFGTRETTEGMPPVIPELILVGHVNYHTARPSFFDKHQHPDVLEIFYIARGKVSWWVEGVSHEVEGNHVFLVWPRELHGARNDIVEPAEYYWIQVHLPSLRENIQREDTDLLKDLLSGTSDRKFAASSTLVSLYQSLLKEHSKDDAYRQSVIRQTLQLLLSLLLRYSRTSTLSKPEANAFKSRLLLAMDWAKRNVSEATPDEMARVSGLDKTVFRRHFQEAFASSPSQYLIRLRLQNAKEQIARGISITEAAHQLGFSSSQYFATVFRKYEGLSPTDYFDKSQGLSTSTQA